MARGKALDISAAARRLTAIDGGRSGKARPRSRASDRVVAAIDVGGAKTACIVGLLTPIKDSGFEIDVIGVGQHGALGSERSTGVETSLRNAVEAAERMAGERVGKAYVAVRGRSVRGRRIGVDLETAGGAVTAEDVRDCVAAGARAVATEGFSPLHALPIRYLVDGEPAFAPGGAEPPIGCAGDVLTAELLALGVRESAAANLETLIGRCGLELQGLVAAPIGAAEAVLTEDEKELGVIVLDMGARSTDFAVYDRGAPVACGAIGLGGEHVTRDIAQIFGSPLAHAERAKTLQGSALIGPGDENRLIDFPQLADRAEVERHSRAELASVIVSRLEETFELAFGAAAEAAQGRQTIRRAVLTGGASLLTGARETAERVMGVKTRLGRPASLAGAPDAATAPHFAAAIGVLAYVARNRASGANADLTGAQRGLWSEKQVAAAGFVGGLASWLRANF